jgi:hypothetical protein
MAILFPTLAELAVPEPEIVTFAPGLLGSTKVKTEAATAAEASYCRVPVMYALVAVISTVCVPPS